MFRSGASGDRRGTPIALIVAIAAVAFFSTFSIAGTQTALGVSILLYVALAVVGRVQAPHRTSLDLPLLVFVIVSLAAVLCSDERMASLRGIKNLLLVSVVYLLAYGVSTWNEARRLFAVLLFSGAASSVFGVAVFLLGRGEGALGRSPGTFSTAMTFGGIELALCSLFVAVALGTGIGGRARAAVGAAACASLAALFFSFTRSSWLGMVVSFFVILALLRRRWLIPFAVGLVLFSALLPAPYRGRITSMWDPSYRTNVQRIELLRGGWEIFKEHPVIGVGTRDLAELYREHMPPGAVHVHGHMHNIFLQIAVQMGAVGFAAFVFLLVAFFILIARNLKLDLPPPERAFAVGSLGALAGFVVNGLFEWNFGDAEVVTMLYLVVGANVAIALIAGGARKGGTGAVE